MPDLIDDLGRLHRDDLPDVTDVAVAADLRRGRRALHRRRVRRGATTALTAGLVAVVAAVGFGLADGGSNHGPAMSDGTVTSPLDPSPAVALVAWNGAQLPGFTVDYVPEGFVLQGATESVLDIARPDDTSSLDSFVGKLVVMLSDQPTRADGDPIAIGGHRGWYRQGDGATTLTYNDGTHDVVIQAWDDLGLNRMQLVEFAEGVPEPRSR